MTMSIQDFIKEVVLPAIQKLSPEEKRAFREAWLYQVAEKEHMRNSDRQFLKACGIDPDGD
jgi:hypothetical protein